MIIIKTFVFLALPDKISLNDILYILPSMANNRSNPLVLVTTVVMALAIPISIYILRTENLDFNFQAFGTTEPQNVIISDKTSKSFRVSWMTEKATQGGVRIEGAELPTLDNESVRYHTVLVKNLAPGVVYKFNIISAGEEFQNGTEPYKAETISTADLETQNFLVYGQVFAADGISYQKNGLITIQLIKNQQKSQLLSTTLNEVGGFQFNLKSLLNDSFTGLFPYKEEADVEVTVYSLDLTEPIVKKYTLNLLGSRQLPNIYLGTPVFNEIPGIDGAE